jgi:AraC-like DNA-binding protein
MLPVFEAWNLDDKPIPARSRLYSLAPIGIGTAFVESLSGYLSRLAGAHAVSAGSLVAKEISGSLKPGKIHVGLVSYAINGVGVGAKQWVQVLETLTLRSDLRYLTLLPFERLFPKPFLFRRARAWCPACYDQMASQGEPIYEPLLWCLKLVEVCPRHRQPLTTTCPRCLRYLRPLSAVSRLGCCPRCDLWLGQASHRTDHPPSEAVPTEYQLWLADAVGDLLANAPQIEPERLRDHVRGALSAYTHKFAEGNRTAVAEMAGCRRNAFYTWFRGDKTPRIDSLLRTWYQLQLPVRSLLETPSPELPPEARGQKSLEILTSREVAPKRSRDQIRAALEEALHEQPPPSLTQVARRLGYASTSRLRKANGDLCQRIILNHRASGQSHWWMRRGAKPICELSHVKKVLEDYLASDKPIPTLDRIAASLGYAVDQSLWQKFPELCLALSARIAQQKRARVAAIEPALEQALQETPPPSLLEAAKRLGFSASCVLKFHAPGLYAKLKKHRQAYHQKCRAELRDRLEAALVENPPPSLKSVYSRLGVTESIVNTSFPELRRASGLRHLQHQREQAQLRRAALRTEIRDIVRMLHAQGICPSVPRVRSLLKSGPLRDWKEVSKEVNDARKKLIDSFS